MKSRSRQRTELGYVRDAYRRLRTLGVPSLWEAAILGRSADLLYLYDDALITVEFKLRDWRRALHQARDHQVGGDFSYVCVPREPTPALRKAARSDGIGVMRFEEEGLWPFSIIEPAARSSRTWPVLRDELRWKLRIKPQISHALRSG